MFKVLCNKQMGIYSLLGCLLLILVACGSPSGPSGPPQSSGGPITITIDHTTYQASNKVQVTVTNTTQMPIYALDLQASCSILGLEMQVSNVWQTSQAAPCTLTRHAAPVQIAAGTSYSATISAGTSPGQGSFPAGTYRLVLHYLTTPTFPNLQAAVSTTYSPTFSVA